MDDDKLLEVTQSVIGLANKVIDDRSSERKTESKNKNLLIGVLIIVIVGFFVLWGYEIHKSYDYGYNVEIENKAVSEMKTEGVSRDAK